MSTLAENLPDPASIAVSRNFRLTKLLNARLEDKIDVFEDQTNGWILDHAQALVSPKYDGRDHSGLAVLILVLPYFESIASFLRGESSEHRSGEFFGAGLQEVFPAFRASAEDERSRDAAAILNRLPSSFYAQLRCGLFHESIIRNKVVVRKQDAPAIVAIDLDTHEIRAIYIDPVLFLAKVRGHFQRYIAQLRDEKQTELRANFAREWDRRSNQPGPLLVPGPADSTETQEN